MRWGTTGSVEHRRHAGQGEHGGSPLRVPVGAIPKGTLPGTVGRIVQDFKTDATFEYAFGVRHYDWHPFERRLLQRSYYERIVRGERELAAVRAYIRSNPQRWAWDEENPDRDPSEPADPPPLPDGPDDEGPVP